MTTTLTTTATTDTNNTNTTTTTTACGPGSSNALDCATERLWQVVPPIIIVLGLLGNGLVVVVFSRLHFSKSSTLVHMFVLAVTDSVILCLGPMRYWLIYTFDNDLRDLSRGGCKLGLFILYTSLDFSAWILVSVTVERALCVLRPLHVRGWFTVRRTLYRLAVILVFLSLLNGHYFYTNDLVPDAPSESDALGSGNVTSSGGGLNVTGTLASSTRVDLLLYTCSSINEDTFFFEEKIFVFIDLSFDSFIPFVVMAVCNGLVIRALKKAGRSRPRTTTRRELARSQATRTSSDPLSSQASGHPRGQSTASIRARTTSEPVSPLANGHMQKPQFPSGQSTATSIPRNPSDALSSTANGQFPSSHSHSTATRISQPPSESLYSLANGHAHHPQSHTTAPAPTPDTIGELHGSRQHGPHTVPLQRRSSAQSNRLSLASGVSDSATAESNGRIRIKPASNAAAVLGLSSKNETQAEFVSLELIRESAVIVSGVVDSDAVTVEVGDYDTAQSHTVTSSSVDPETVNCNTVSPSSVNYTTVDFDTVNSNAVNPSCVDSNTVNSNAVNPSCVDSNTVNSNAVNPSCVDSNTVRVTCNAVNADSENSNTVHPSSENSNTVNTHPEHSNTVNSTTVVTKKPDTTKYNATSVKIPQTQDVGRRRISRSRGRPFPSGDSSSKYPKFQSKRKVTPPPPPPPSPPSPSPSPSPLPSSLQPATRAVSQTSNRRRVSQTHHNGPPSSSSSITSARDVSMSTGVTRMLILVTSVFLVTTLPASLYYIMDSFVREEAEDSVRNRVLDLLQAVTNLLQFCNYGCNFLLYSARSKRFRLEVRYMLGLVNSRFRRHFKSSVLSGTMQGSLKKSSRSSAHGTSIVTNTPNPNPIPLPTLTSTPNGHPTSTRETTVVSVDEHSTQDGPLCNGGEKASAKGSVSRFGLLYPESESRSRSLFPPPEEEAEGGSYTRRPFWRTKSSKTGGRVRLGNSLGFPISEAEEEVQTKVAGTALFSRVLGKLRLDTNKKKTLDYPLTIEVTDDKAIDDGGDDVDCDKEFVVELHHGNKRKTLDVSGKSEDDVDGDKELDDSVVEQSHGNTTKTLDIPGKSEADIDGDKESDDSVVELHHENKKTLAVSVKSEDDVDGDKELDNSVVELRHANKQTLDVSQKSEDDVDGDKELDDVVVEVRHANKKTLAVSGKSEDDVDDDKELDDFVVEQSHGNTTTLDFSGKSDDDADGDKELDDFVVELRHANKKKTLDVPGKSDDDVDGDKELDDSVVELRHGNKKTLDVLGKSEDDVDGDKELDDFVVELHHANKTTLDVSGKSDDDADGDKELDDIVVELRHANKQKTLDVPGKSEDDVDGDKEIDDSVVELRHANKKTLAVSGKSEDDVDGDKKLDDSVVELRHENKKTLDVSGNSDYDIDGDKELDDSVVELSHGNKNTLDVPQKNETVDDKDPDRLDLVKDLNEEFTASHPHLSVTSPTNVPTLKRLRRGIKRMSVKSLKQLTGKTKRSVSSEDGHFANVDKRLGRGIRRMSMKGLKHLTGKTKRPISSEDGHFANVDKRLGRGIKRESVKSLKQLTGNTKRSVSSEDGHFANVDRSCSNCSAWKSGTTTASRQPGEISVVGLAVFEQCGRVCVRL